MASLELTGFEELEEAFRTIANIPDSVKVDALNSMAAVAAEKIRSQGESMGVKDPESSVHILDKISTRSKAKTNEFGGYKYITFTGSHTNSKGKKRRNAEIAFINEYGKRGQPARPFIETALKRYSDEIAAPGLRALGEWMENNFHE